MTYRLLTAACAFGTLLGFAYAQNPRLITDFPSQFGFDRNAPPSFESIGARAITSMPFGTSSSTRHTALLEIDATARRAKVFLALERDSVPRPSRGIRALAKNFLFLSAKTRRLMWSDGTARGTRALTTPPLGLAAGQNISEEVDGTVYFGVSLNGNRTEFWRMRHGTRQPAFAFSLSTGSIPGNVSNWRRIPGTGRAVFAMSDNSGRGLWVTDGTSPGSRKLRSDISPRYPIPFGRKILFVGSTTSTGAAIFETDGTRAGTKLFVDPFSGARDGVLGPLEVLGKQIVFQGFVAGQRRLFITDGTTTRELAVRNAARPSVPSYFRRLGAHVYFNAMGGPTAGNYLWRTDGTDKGTELVSQRIWPIAWSDGERPALHRHLHTLVFSATGPKGEDIWAYDAPGAVVSRIGTGCGDVASVPDLDSTRPVLARTMEFSVLPLPAGSVGAFVLGAADLDGTTITSSCISRVDLTKFFIVADSWLAKRDVTHRAKLPVPNETRLLGVEVAAQVWNLLRSGRRSLAVSNGLSLRVGR